MYEAHQDQAWLGPQACTCGAAGAPCPNCNFASPDYPLAPASHEGIATNEAARLHPISIWLHNQIVSRMVIGVP